MNSKSLSIETLNDVVVLTMDDGKNNVISTAMIDAIHSGLDMAEKSKSVVVLSGRENMFSAGFDLKTLNRGGASALGMLSGGFQLAERMLSFPTPIVVACSGHAIAMGAFLLLSGDYRVGAFGPFRIATNEVAIGLVMPQAAIEICKQRLTPGHFTRSTILGETYTPQAAVDAGFLDQLVEKAELKAIALQAASHLGKIDFRAHHKTKLKARKETLQALKKAITVDRGGFALEGARRYFSTILEKRAR